MSDVFWATIIGAVVAVAGGALTQLLTMIREDKQRRNTERQQEANWQRSEASRKEKAMRKTRRLRQKMMADRIEEYWEHILTARIQTHKRVDAFLGNARWTADDEMPSASVGRASLIAMLWLPDVFPLTTAFYRTTDTLELAAGRDSKDDVIQKLTDWNGSFSGLQNAVFNLAREVFADVDRLAACVSDDGTVATEASNKAV